jgi:hypothetical protein
MTRINYETKLSFEKVKVFVFVFVVKIIKVTIKLSNLNILYEEPI